MVRVRVRVRNRVLTVSLAMLIKTLPSKCRLEKYICMHKRYKYKYYIRQVINRLFVCEIDI